MATSRGGGGGETLFVSGAGVGRARPPAADDEGEPPPASGGAVLAVGGGGVPFEFGFEEEEDELVDRGAERTVGELLEEASSALFGEDYSFRAQRRLSGARASSRHSSSKGGKQARPFVEECKEWSAAFPHLRARGVAVMEQLREEAAAAAAAAAEEEEEEGESAWGAGVQAVPMPPRDDGAAAVAVADPAAVDDPAGELAISGVRPPACTAEEVAGDEERDAEVLAEDGALEETLAIDFSEGGGPSSSLAGPAEAESRETRHARRRAAKGFPPVTPARLLCYSVQRSLLEAVWSDIVPLFEGLVREAFDARMAGVPVLLPCAGASWAAKPGPAAAAAAAAAAGGAKEWPDVVPPADAEAKAVAPFPPPVPDLLPPEPGPSVVETMRWPTRSPPSPLRSTSLAAPLPRGEEPALAVAGAPLPSVSEQANAPVSFRPFPFAPARGARRRRSGGGGGGGGSPHVAPGVGFVSADSDSEDSSRRRRRSAVPVVDLYSDSDSSSSVRPRPSIAKYRMPLSRAAVVSAVHARRAAAASATAAAAAAVSRRSFPVPSVPDAAAPAAAGSAAWPGPAAHQRHYMQYLERQQRSPVAVPVPAPAPAPADPEADALEAQRVALDQKRLELEEQQAALQRQQAALRQRMAEREQQAAAAQGGSPGSGRRRALRVRIEPGPDATAMAAAAAGASPPPDCSRLLSQPSAEEFGFGDDVLSANTGSVAGASSAGDPFSPASTWSRRDSGGSHAAGSDRGSGGAGGSGRHRFFQTESNRGSGESARSSGASATAAPLVLHPAPLAGDGSATDSPRSESRYRRRRSSHATVVHSAAEASSSPAWSESEAGAGSAPEAAGRGVPRRRPSFGRSLTVGRGSGAAGRRFSIGSGSGGGGARAGPALRRAVSTGQGTYRPPTQQQQPPPPPPPSSSASLPPPPARERQNSVVGELPGARPVGANASQRAQQQRRASHQRAQSMPREVLENMSRGVPAERRPVRKSPSAPVQDLRRRGGSGGSHLAHSQSALFGGRTRYPPAVAAALGMRREDTAAAATEGSGSTLPRVGRRAPPGPFRGTPAPASRKKKKKKGKRGTVKRAQQ